MIKRKLIRHHHTHISYFHILEQKDKPVKEEKIVRTSNINTLNIYIDSIYDVYFGSNVQSGSESSSMILCIYTSTDVMGH